MKNTAINIVIAAIENNENGLLDEMRKIATAMGFNETKWNEFKCFTAAKLATELLNK